jgi:hypothetical protein
MGDFSPVVLILTGSMLDGGKDLTMRLRITPESVGDQPPRCFALALQHFAKESFSSTLVPLSGQQDVENLAVLIDCSPEVKLLSLNLCEQLVCIPDIAQSTLLFLQCSGVPRPELQTPEADGFVRNNGATLG